MTDKGKKERKLVLALELDSPAPREQDDEKLSKKERAERAMSDWPPTARDFRAWMDLNGLSNKDVAKALKLSDGRVVRFWTAKKNPRKIPYPSWYTLRHKFAPESIAPEEASGD
ncbi:MAG TPA: hypothetical protein VLA56_08190, partial [Pseudomonadales bacterium]|nr:hypothetical protein [Pseudomonadales bacterium]